MCAKTCFARGEAAILMAADGTGYVLYADNGSETLLDDAKASAGTRVAVSGFVRERGGLKGISLRRVQVVKPAM